MGRRGHDRVAGVHSRAAEAEVVDWLAAGGTWPCALRVRGAWLPVRLGMVVRPVGFCDLKRLAPDLGDIYYSLFFLSGEHSLKEISRVLLREFIHAFGFKLPTLMIILL